MVGTDINNKEKFSIDDVMKAVSNLSESEKMILAFYKINDLCALLNDQTSFNNLVTQCEFNIKGNIVLMEAVHKLQKEVNELHSSMTTEDKMDALLNDYSKLSKEDKLSFSAKMTQLDSMDVSLLKFQAAWRKLVKVNNE